MTCMYSLRLSPSGMRISIGTDPAAAVSARATPALDSVASFWRVWIAAIRRSTDRTLSRYSSSLCWSSALSFPRRSFAPPSTRSSIDRSSASADVLPAGVPAPASRHWNSRLRTFRGFTSAGIGCRGPRKLQCE